MHISRSMSITLAVGILGLFFASSVYLIQRRSVSFSRVTAKDQQESEMAALQKQLQKNGADNPKLTLQNFSRSQVKDGRKIWEISATEGKYDPKTEIAILTGAKLLLYRKEGDVVHLDADNATIHLNGRELLK